MSHEIVSSQPIAVHKLDVTAAAAVSTGAFSLRTTAVEVACNCDIFVKVGDAGVAADANSRLFPAGRHKLLVASTDEISVFPAVAAAGNLCTVSEFVL